jgi:hypothetical protein
VPFHFTELQYYYFLSLFYIYANGHVYYVLLKLNNNDNNIVNNTLSYCQICVSCVKQNNLKKVISVEIVHNRFSCDCCVVRVGILWY